MHVQLPLLTRGANSHKSETLQVLRKKEDTTMIFWITTLFFMCFLCGVMVHFFCLSGSSGCFCLAMFLLAGFMVGFVVGVVGGGNSDQFWNKHHCSL